jgi:hypothetical protein
VAKLTPEFLKYGRDTLQGFAALTMPKYRAAKCHIKLCHALEKVESGETKRLMITYPPQHGKTEHATRRFPAWYLGRNPSDKIMSTAYSASKAERESKRCRAILDLPVYEAIFPDVSVKPGMDTAAFWGLGQGGQMLAAGVGGGITGEGADLLIIDDPVKDREEAESDTYREKTWDWFTGVASTRLSQNGAIIVIMTRWHQDDLAGRLLATEPDRWKVLKFPAIDDDGNVLWPEKYGLDYLKQQKKLVGTYDWSSLYQGEPTAKGGMVVRSDWFSRQRGTIISRQEWEQRKPSMCSQVTYVDLAASSKQTAD